MVNHSGTIIESIKKGRCMMSAKSHSAPSTTPILAALETTFKAFDERFFELKMSKTAVITLSQRRVRSASGWCSDEEIWEDGRKETCYEINICPEDLGKPIEDTCAILLHQMIHLWNALNEVKDGSRASQYHNSMYKKSAERFGLKAEKSEFNGFSETTLTPETLEFVRTLKLSGFDLFRHENPKAEKAPKNASTYKYVCVKCENLLRATKRLNVRCEDCNELFEERV